MHFTSKRIVSRVLTCTDFELCAQDLNVPLLMATTRMEKTHGPTCSVATAVLATIQQ